MEHLPYPFVSVIIPVLNDSERLKKCLKALEDQTYPKNHYEVVVVDNGSDDKIESVVCQFNQTLLIYESRRSSYMARNKGFSIAKGEVIAFTDSDCIPTPNWIEKGVENILRIPNCGLVAGRVEIFFKDPKRPTIAELFESITAFRQKEYIKRWRFGAFANIFTFRRVIDEVGLFDSTLKSGADVEWGRRVFSAGYKQIYADDVQVLHPARFLLHKIYRKHVRIVGGLYNMQKKKDYTIRQFIVDLKDDWPQFRDFFGVCLDDRLKSYRQKIKVLFVMFFVKLVRISKRIHLRFGEISKREYL